MPTKKQSEVKKYKQKELKIKRGIETSNKWCKYYRLPFHNNKECKEIKE